MAEQSQPDNEPSGDGPVIQRLDYPSPPLSPFDRPVDPVVRVAHAIRLVTRVTFILFTIAGLALSAWAVWRLASVFDAAGR